MSFRNWSGIWAEIYPVLFHVINDEKLKHYRQIMMDCCLFISFCRTLGWSAFSEVVCPVPSGGLWWQQWHGQCMNRWWKKWAWNLDWLAQEITSFTPSLACWDQLALGSSQFHRGVSLAHLGGRKPFWHRGLDLLAHRGKKDPIFASFDQCIPEGLHLQTAMGNGRVSTAW